MIGRRHLRSNNSWMHNSERLVKGKVRCTLLIHPDDAAARGLGDGAVARVATPRGSIELPIEITDAMMPGVVSVPHGWGHGRRGTRLRVAAGVPGRERERYPRSRHHRRALRHERAHRPARAGGPAVKPDALFARIGEAKLRAVITDFYGRVFPDVMIGFLFAGKDRARLIDKEYEFTAHFLGADIAYTGRPMRTAHAQSPIFGGHFERRLQLLRDTLRDHGVDPDVQRAWLDHTLALRPQITRDQGSECKDTSVADAPRLAIARPPPDPDAKIKLGRK